MALSLDLGFKNFSWCYINEKNGKWGEFDIDFGLFSLDEDNMKSKIENRVSKLIDFMKEKKNKYNIKVVVIEQQMRVNYQCCQLEYSLVTICKMLDLNYYLFKPLLKFTVIKQEYTTKQRLHKLLSISNAKKFLEKYCKDKVEEFLLYKKKDDIADALNQGLIYCFMNNYWKMDLEEYRKIISFDDLIINN
jgi:hypothetical protein